MLNVGQKVEVVSCSLCQKAVGKMGVIKEVTDSGYRVSFGKGRPQKNRPEFFNEDMLSPVEEVNV